MRRAVTPGKLALLGAIAGSALTTTPSSADPAVANDPPCVVRLMPADAPKEWRRAGGDLRQRIRQWPAPDRDCRELRVEVSDSGALLTITTQDGRQARRQVATAAALVPAASALAVSVEAPSPPPLTTEATTAAESSFKEDNREGAPLGLLFLGGGLRLAAPGAFLSPSIRGAAALQLQGWEIGTFVEGAPLHLLLDGNEPPRFSMTSFSSGLSAGRREHVGGVDLLAGLMFGATFIHQESTTQEINDGEVETDVEEGDGIDFIMGGYFGVATPRGKRVRLRAQFELALPLSHPGLRRELDADLPPLPGWSAAAVVGVEFGVP
ncbi:MAG: hypothetical protein ABW133_23075 [Polyangiaceae bacterium]